MLGVILTASIPTIHARTSAPRIVGGDGFLIGYDIVNEDGETICSDPWVWTGTKEIECK